MGIVAKQIRKSFGTPPNVVLHGLDFEIQDGEFVSVTGKSGSGKSTLLYILSTLDSSTSGEMVLDGKSLSTMRDSDVHLFRNLKMGFVFQFHYLLPELTSLENVLMPAMKTGREKEFREKGIQLLTDFGLADKLNRFPSQLSGGEQQRVAIARALVMGPKYIFADEPTGNLDSVNAEAVMSLFKKINKEQKTTIIFVTHDKDFASLAKRRIHLVDGKIVDPD